MNLQSSPEEEIALFRSRFQGREDVFARRYENRNTGKSGYAPACANEWVRGICEKPRIKCAQCPHRDFIPISDQVIYDHLIGKHVVGIYPMLPDESCRFLALDLDKADWEKDAEAIVSVCKEKDIPHLLERSRSINGAHIWVFFQEAIPSVTARKLGSSLITRAMNKRPELGFDSYDRMFPNQDTLPRGGFGNLIALPLQGKSRKQGGSVFMRDPWCPSQDPWEHLMNVPCLTVQQVNQILESAERSGDVLNIHSVPEDEAGKTPWLTPPSGKSIAKVSGPHPDTLNLVLSDQLYIPKEHLTPSLRNRILRIAAFQNPEFYKAQAMRLPTFHLPRIISCAEEHPEHIGLPRGCTNSAKTRLSDSAFSCPGPG